MNKENKKKRYLIYQTTNLVNNKIYIGKHITENIEDQYFGSGKYLKRAIEKYGLENFEFKILFELQNEDEMNLLEKCVITQEFCDRKDTYNINVGGDGGWSYINNKSDFQLGSSKRKNRFHAKGGKTAQQKYKEQYGSLTKYIVSKMSDDEYKSYCDAIAQSNIQWHKEHPGYFAGKNNPMFGKKHSESSCKSISDAMKTNKNFMKDATWYVNYETEENILLKTGDYVPKGFVKGRCCDFKKYKEKALNKIKKQEEKQRQLEILKQQLTLMAKIYEQYGIEKVQQEYPNFVGTSSASAFCHILKRYKIQYKKYQKRKNK